MNDAQLTLCQIDYSIVNGVKKETVGGTSEVWGAVKSVGYNEFYAASAAGYKADVILEVYSFEYSGEQEVFYNDDVYDVIRSYQTTEDRIQLTCSRRAKK